MKKILVAFVIFLSISITACESYYNPVNSSGNNENGSGNNENGSGNNENG